MTDLLPLFAAGLPGDWPMWAGLVLLVVASLVLWWGLRPGLKGGPRMGRPAPTGPSPARWLARAEASAGRGDYAEGVDAVWRGLLMALERAEVLDRRRVGEARQLGAAFSGPDFGRELLLDLAHQVALVRKNPATATEDRYRLVREGAQQVAATCGAWLE